MIIDVSGNFENFEYDAERIEFEEEGISMNAEDFGSTGLVLDLGQWGYHIDPAKTDEIVAVLHALMAASGPLSRWEKESDK